MENDNEESWIVKVPRLAIIVRMLRILERSARGIQKNARQELQDAVKEKIFKTLGPIAEVRLGLFSKLQRANVQEWSGVRLQPTSVYGIRRYLNRC